MRVCVANGTKIVSIRGGGQGEGLVCERERAALPSSPSSSSLFGGRMATCYICLTQRLMLSLLLTGDFKGERGGEGEGETRGLRWLLQEDKEKDFLSSSFSLSPSSFLLPLFGLPLLAVLLVMLLL